MRAHYLQHVPFEGPGYIETWLGMNGIPPGRTRLYAGDSFPELNEFELLVVMGGPMSANDEAGYPWIVEEKQFIRRAIEEGKAVLGICLGAQLIANSLGANVYPGKEKEIGWFPIFPVSGGLFSEETTVFHWHGETFDLPEGAVHLARSEVCENQAFRMGERVIGLQFHLETTPETVVEMVENGMAELEESAWIQSPEVILEKSPEGCAGANGQMESVLRFLLRGENDAGIRAGFENVE